MQSNLDELEQRRARARKGGGDFNFNAARLEKLVKYRTWTQLAQANSLGFHPA